MAAACIATVVLFPTAGVGAVSGPQGSSVASVDRTYVDASGDTIGRLDVLSVRAEATGGRLHMRINLREKTINSSETVGVVFDTDSGSATFGADVQLIFQGGGAGALYVTRWTGSSWGPVTLVSPSQHTFGAIDFGVTLTSVLSAIGNPSRIKFWSYSKSVTSGSVDDFAPNSGFWEFDISSTSPPPPPQQPPPPPTSRPIEVKRSFIRPESPRAGSPVVVGANFVYSGTNQAVRGGTVRCRGRVGSRSLPGKTAHAGGTGTCSFRLPANAAGKTFSGRVTLGSQGYEAWSELTRPVVGAQRLVLVKAGTSAPGHPLAGQRFDVSFKVIVKRPGAPDESPAKANVDCSATVDGRSLAPSGEAYISTFEAAQCVWRVPSSARGSTLRGRIVVRTPQGLTASQRFSYPVR